MGPARSVWKRCCVMLAWRDSSKLQWSSGSPYTDTIHLRADAAADDPVESRPVGRQLIGPGMFAIAF